MSCKFNVGDRIICKKYYEVHDSYDSYDTAYMVYISFLEGSEYEVVEIDQTYGFYTMITIKYNSEKCYNFVGDYIYDYFYTEQELRKLKLEKLEDREV